MKRPDGFITAVSHFFNDMFSHAKGLILLLGGLLLFGLGVGFYLNHRETVAHEAANGLYLAEKALETEMKVVSGADQAKDSAKTAPAAGADAFEYQKLDVDSKLPEAVKKLKAVIQDYPGTRSAYEGEIRLAGLYYRHGEPAKAIQWYERAVQDSSGNFEKATSLAMLGNTLENAGKSLDAIQNYQKALNLGEGSLKGDLLLGIARNHESLHDSAKARSTYDQILAELPNTEHARSAEIFKSQL